MATVGIRELKARLSHHLKRVRAGATVVVTERGRSIATISRVEPATDLSWAHRLIAEGRASWSGGKPRGASNPPRMSSAHTLADAVLEDRR